MVIRDPDDMTAAEYQEMMSHIGKSSIEYKAPIQITKILWGFTMSIVFQLALCIPVTLGAGFILATTWILHLR